MKNLKKLSVVLFATLLSFNFTSCIDDGVSDAVDQVYLAQAEFLKAQAALKEAEAQHELADAAYAEAQAAHELAIAAHQEALTAGVILDNEGKAQTNAHTAQLNIQALAQAQSDLDLALQTNLVALVEQQRLYDIAMVNLGEAVAAAKDLLIVGYYTDYAYVTGELQDLYKEKIEAETDLALRELMLVSLSGNTTNPIDLVSMAYYQAMLEGELAELEGALVAEEANLVALQAITADDAADTNKAITDLEDQIAVLQEQYDALVIEKVEKANERDQAHEAWLAATGEYNDLSGAETDYINALAAKKAHTDAIEDAEDAIADAAANVAAIPAAQDAFDAIDDTAALQGIADAKQLIEDKAALIGSDYVASATIADPKLTDSPKAVATAWDNVWNAELLAKQAAANYDSIAKYMAPSTSYGSPYVYLNDLELDLVSAINAVSGTLPADIATAQDEYDAALLREVAAQDAFNADPAGDTWTDGTDSGTTFPNPFVGDHTDGAVTDSYKRVLTWQELPTTGSGLWYPLTYTADATIPAIPVVAGFSEFDASAGINTVDKDAAIANTLAFFVEVENDDTPINNLDELHLARYYSRIAEDNLNALLGTQTGEIKSIADAQYLLDLGYTALGHTPPPTSDPTMSDWNNALELMADALKDKNDAIAAIGFATNSFGTTISSPYDTAEKATAYYQVLVAEAVHAGAVAALGFDFRPAGNDWTTRYEAWVAQTALALNADAYTNAAPTNMAESVYQPLDEQVGPSSTLDRARLYLVPHIATSSYTPTAYEVLRNVYFEMVWAQEAIDALATVSYKRLYDASGEIASPATATYSNEKATTYATADKAALEALLPAHDAAIEYFKGIFDDLAAEFNFDMTLWDVENGHTGLMAYIPAYTTYLDALAAYNAVIAEFTTISTQIEDLENLIEGYSYLQDLNPTVASAESVADFMAGIADKIYDDKGTPSTSDDTGSLVDIADLKESIEIQKGLVATGIVDAETAQAWITEYERRLGLIETEIEGFEAAAASLLARINALLN